ncbi:hypothetical protein ON010_g19090 [Phytophthora cinnamomi]|nr:hypothetical protein ON010_g19090 [Phytophthora cinnamomi]
MLPTPHEREVPEFPGLSQVASVGGASLSQFSFADASSQLTTKADVEVRGRFQPKSGGIAVPEDDSTEVVCEDTGADDNATSVKNTESQDDTEPTQISTEPGVSSTESVRAVNWAFADRPVINGMTEEQRKRAQAKQDSETALQLAAKYRQGKVSKFVSFDEVAALLDGPYNLFHSKPMVDALILPNVDVVGPLSVRSSEVGQAIPVIKRIPPLPVVVEAIEAIKLKQNVDLLAYWSDYGYATFDQLDAMASIAEARQRFLLSDALH